jgi:hypothetical protein
MLNVHAQATDAWLRTCDLITQAVLLKVQLCMTSARLSTTEYW